MKTLALMISSLFLLCACGTNASNQTISNGETVEVKADTTSQDTLKIEKRKVPKFPKDDDGMEKMDEVVNRAKEQRL